jgi:hypothetical protein
MKWCKISLSNRKIAIVLKILEHACMKNLVKNKANSIPKVKIKFDFCAIA